MKNTDFAILLGNIDDSLVYEAQPLMKRKRIWYLPGIAIACLIFVIIGASAYYITNNRSTNSDASIAIVLIPIDGKQAVYKYLNIDEDSIKNKQGLYYESFDTKQIYLLKDVTTYHKLILVEDGHYSMVEFLEFAEPVSFNTVLGKIYGADSGEDIDSILIYKNSAFNTDYCNSIEIPDVLLFDDEAKNRLYEILSSIQISEVDESSDEETKNSNTTFMSGKEMEIYETNHSRLIDIYFKNGEKITLLYYSDNNHFYAYDQTLTWSQISDEDNDWLMEQAKITE